MPRSLSAILIARNEEVDLPSCLDSLKGLADEIVLVVSSDTNDRTEHIALQRGARVARREFDDYARQRQHGLTLATKDWCLWVDADERVSAELSQEIRAVLSGDPRAAAYAIPFHVHFLGRRLRWGGLGSESHVRLFQRDRGRFCGGSLHEVLEISGQVSSLRGAMIHHPYRDISDYLGKLDRYTTLSAEKKRAAGARFYPWRHAILPGEFFFRIFLKLGFLDGFPGLVWAGLAAFHSWLKYVKLGEMERGRTSC